MEYLMSKKFETHLCDFYDDNADEVWLTREQIGSALGYTNPSESIRLIHNRHKERLDKFCVRTKIQAAEIGDSHEAYQNDTVREDGLNTSRSQNKHLQSEVVLYSQRGVMEICRWSDMPKADQFMDWVWDIVEGYRHKELVSLKNAIELNDKVIKEISHSIEVMSKKSAERFKYLNTKMQEQEKRQEEVYSLSVKNSTTLQTIDMSAYAAITEEAEWASELSPRIHKLADVLTHGNRDKCMDRIIELAEEKRYFKDSFQDLLTHYCTTHQGQKTYKKIFVVAQFEEDREGFEQALTDLEKEWGIYTQSEGQMYYEQLTKDMMSPHEEIVPEFHNKPWDPSNEELEAIWDTIDKMP